MQYLIKSGTVLSKKSKKSSRTNKFRDKSPSMKYKKFARWEEVRT